MLWSPVYLKRRLPRPLPTKDGGILYTVADVRSYTLRLPESRSNRRYWQRACHLLLDQADVAALGPQVELALFCDAQLDIEMIHTA
jgi:hypothetical protein